MEVKNTITRLLTRRTPVRLMLLALLQFIAASSLRAEVVADWGTIATPIQQDTTFNVAQSGIDSNFSHDYNFSLEGAADTAYSVTFNFNYCTHGCGNVETTYGIYDQNGSLISDVTDGGTLSLSSGDYTLQVKGTGFGAGNSVDYQGSVTFFAASAPTSTMISPAPEPDSIFLMLAGALVAGLFRLRSRFRPRALAQHDISACA